MIGTFPCLLKLAVQPEFVSEMKRSSDDANDARNVVDLEPMFKTGVQKRERSPEILLTVDVDNDVTRPETMGKPNRVTLGSFNLPNTEFRCVVSRTTVLAGLPIVSEDLVSCKSSFHPC